MGGAESEFYESGMIWGPHFERFSGTQAKKSSFVFGFVSLLISTLIFGLKSTAWGSAHQVFALKVVRKLTSRRSGIVDDFGVVF